MRRSASSRAAPYGWGRATRSPIGWRACMPSCLELVATWRPDAIVLERNFVAHNVQSAFRIGEVRGVVLSAAATAGHAVHEYAPAAVKLAAVGHGAADKETVTRGVVALLGLVVRPSVDAADALALALCHLQQAPFLAALARAERTVPVRRATR